MCNLYSLTKGQAAIRDWFRARHDRTGNLPLFPGVFPDQMAPMFVTARTASASSSWRAGACRGRRVWRRARREHSQSDKPALARMVGPARPQHRSCDLVLRVRGYKAAQGAHVVRAERG